MTATHELKTWPDHFQAILEGRKTFELRRDDRGFQENDWLVLREYAPDTDEYTGREVRTWISHVLRDAPHFGLMPGYVVLSLGGR